MNNNAILNSMIITEKMKDRFWLKVDKSKECWLWIGAKNWRNYGVYRVGKKQVSTHRFSYLISKGDVEGWVVMHKCDNTLCVNPSHLSIGTQLDNMRDMIKKGRKRCRIKLTEEMVRMIKTELLHKRKNSQISKKYSISNTTIQNIKRNKIWKTVSI